MIKNIIVQKRILHFKEPFQIAYEKAESAEVVIIEISDGSGNYGLGSASPDSKVTGETIGRTYKKIREKLNKGFFDYNVENWYKYHEKIQQEFIGLPAAQSAVEEAVLNFFCSRKKIKLASIFGGYREKCPMMITIGIKSIEETLKEVKKRIKENYKIVKLKCGLNLKEDIIKIKKIDKLLPENIAIVLDANGGYSFEKAKNLLGDIKKTKVKFIEQPIAARNIQEMKALNFASKIPVIADESAVSVDDAVRLLTGDYVAGVNIKLMKCGGPVNFLKIFNLAKALNKIVMIGCMYESQISLTTSAHLALALPVDYVDLDSGQLDFIDDPASGGLVIRKGQIDNIRPLNLRQEIN